MNYKQAIENDGLNAFMIRYLREFRGIDVSDARNELFYMKREYRRPAVEPKGFKHSRSECDSLRVWYIPDKAIAFTLSTDSRVGIFEGLPKAREGVYIFGVWVAPEHRGKGLAGELVRWIRRESAGARLYVAIHRSNASSIRAFSKAGFGLLKTVPDPYPDTAFYSG